MDKKSENKKTWSAYQLAMNLGFMIVVPMIVFAVGGVLLDRYFNSYPIFIFIGFVLALASGLTIVFIKTKNIIVQGIPKKKKNSAQTSMTNDKK